MSLSLQTTPERGAQREHPAGARAAGPTPDARLTARFGAEVLAGGYTAVPNLVLRYAPHPLRSNTSSTGWPRVMRGVGAVPCS